MKELDKEVKNLLKSTYKIATEIIFAIHVADKDFASRVGQKLEKYKVRHLIDAFQKSADAVSKLVLFFGDYVESILKGLEFFSNLFFALGIKNYFEIINQKNKLEDVIQPETIDLDFLKFHIRTTEELIYPQFEKIILKTIEDLEPLREIYAILDSEPINKFMKEIEKQESSWYKIQNRINMCFSTVEKEKDISTCVNQISEVINEFIMFTVNLRNLESNLYRIMDCKLEHSLDNVKQFSEIIKQLGRDLIMLVNCRAKGAEYISDSFILILAMLWGSKETAHKKFQSVIKSEMPLEDLIPPKFSLEDLRFALVQARNQILLADRAHRRVQETVNAMRSAADYFNSSVLREYYEIIVKEIEIINEYLPQYNQNLIELQNILNEKQHEIII